MGIGGVPGFLKGHASPERPTIILTPSALSHIREHGKGCPTFNAVKNEVIVLIIGVLLVSKASNSCHVSLLLEQCWDGENPQTQTQHVRSLKRTPFRSHIRRVYGEAKYISPSNASHKKPFHRTMGLRLGLARSRTRTSTTWGGS